MAPFPGYEAWAAVTMLVQLARAQRMGLPESFAALREHAALSEHRAEAVLGRLAEANWVSRTDEGDWVLTRAPSQILLAEILSRFALDIEAWKRAAGVPQEKQDHDIIQRLEEGLRLGGETLDGLSADHLA